MARYVDIDKPVIIPISDAVLGDIKYEQQVTLGELFEGLVDGPELEVVDAIPVEWLRKYEDEPIMKQPIQAVLYLWEKENGVK